jgi:dihydrofolate synthase/folylpolyglutamate synthase
LPITYKQALDYIYGLTNYEVKSAFAYAPQFFDLARVDRLLAVLGNPHRQFKSIHVAGTKGKGSTSAMLASVLQAAGYRTGLYTSPHLHAFRERIQVDGALISEGQFAAWIERLRPLAEQDKELTTFEVATAAAFAHFADVGVEIAVVEVGLGGRLDATNVVQPLVSIITTIGHDHMHILGKRLTQIAAEKAGIIKPGVPVVSAPQKASALAVIRRTCEEKRSPLHAVGHEWSWRATSIALNGQEFAASGRADASANARRIAYSRLHIPLLGRHQLRNAAGVLCTVDLLRQAGVHISDPALRQGLRDVVWPARFEVMGCYPSFVVDGAHNVDSARSLVATLRQYFPGLKPWFVLAILADKDVHAILRVLLPYAQGAIVARSRHPRAADPWQLQKEAAPYPAPTHVVEDVGQAVLQALDLAGAEGLVVASGSFSTAGAARETWLRLHNMPLPPLDP